MPQGHTVGQGQEPPHALRAQREWENQIRETLDELSEEKLQRVRDEEKEHAPAECLGTLVSLDTLSNIKKPKM